MKKLLPWFTVLLILVVGFGTIYFAVQQAQRNGANSPQIQIAQDTAASLNKGELPATLIGQKVDMAESLAPFTIIYDKKGRVILSSGYIKEKIPPISLGTLDDSKGKDYSAATWQPNKDVRIAAVTVSAKDYYVLSGRSLKEVDKNIARTSQITLLGTIIALGLLGVVFIINGVVEEY